MATRSVMKGLRIGLEVLGAAALLAIVVFGISVVYSGSKDRVNKADRKDVAFILNWAGIPKDQNYRVVSSYESARSFTGDHLDYFCINLPRFEIADQQKGDWHSGPESNPLIAEALQLALDDAHQRGTLCPCSARGKSPAMQMMFPQVLLRNGHATAADIILYDSKQRMLYYVSFKT
jgi:hypothetical protein